MGHATGTDPPPPATAVLVVPQDIYILSLKVLSALSR
jgi:hypothetical protein